MYTVLELRNSATTTITGNVIKSSKYGIMLHSSATGVVMTNNEFDLISQNSIFTDYKTGPSTKAT